MQAPQQFFSGWALGMDNFTRIARQPQQPISWTTKIKRWLTGVPNQDASFPQAFTKSNSSSSGSSNPFNWLVVIVGIGAIGLVGKHFDVWKKLGDFMRSKKPANPHPNPPASTLPKTKAGTAPGTPVPDPIPSAFDELKTKLQGNIGDAKTAIAQIAGHSNDQSLRKELLELACKHEDVGVREEAIKQLHHLSDQKHIDELLKAALDKDKAHVPQLLETAFLHPELSVVNGGLGELSQLGDKDALINFFNQTLTKTPPHPRPLLQVALLHNEQDVVTAGIAKLGCINNPTELNTFIQSILAKNPAQRISILQHCIGHNDLEIVKTGIQSIVNPGISKQNVTSLLRDALANKPEDTFSILDMALHHTDARVKNEGLAQLYATLQKPPIAQSFHNLPFEKKKELLLHTDSSYTILGKLISGNLESVKDILAHINPTDIYSLLSHNQPVTGTILHTASYYNLDSLEFLLTKITPEQIQTLLELREANERNFLEAAAYSAYGNKLGISRILDKATDSKMRVAYLSIQNPNTGNTALHSILSRLEEQNSKDTGALGHLLRTRAKDLTEQELKTIFNIRNNANKTSYQLMRESKIPDIALFCHRDAYLRFLTTSL